MTLVWWQLVALVLIVMGVGKVLVVANRHGWEYVNRRVREKLWLRPRPLAAWLAQDIWQRRRQVLAGLAVACVAAMLLAVALRGIFVYVFILTTGLMALALLLAMFRGGLELRRGSSTAAGQLADIGPHGDLEMGPYAETGIFPTRQDQSTVGVELIDDLPSAVGSPMLDSETPLMFEPLGIDPADLANAGPVEIPAEETLADEVLPDETMPEGLSDTAGPSFSAAPSAGRRQASARARSRKRRKARPIHIESTLDIEAEDYPDTGQASDGH